MINLHEIESTIEKIKREGTSISDAKNLAMLYIVRDRMREEDDGAQSRSKRSASGPAYIPRYEDASEFVRACEGVPVDHVMDVMDEHMSAIRLLYPKEYEKILRRMNA